MLDSVYCENQNESWLFNLENLQTNGFLKNLEQRVIKTKYPILKD